MPNFKPFVTIDNITIKANRKTEKLIVQVFHDITKTGECKIKNAATPEWEGTLIKIGRKTALFEKEMLEPIWRTIRKENRNERLIRKKPEVIVEEKLSDDYAFFKFKRRNIR